MILICKGHSFLSQVVLGVGGGGVERHVSVPLWAKTWAEVWSLGPS